MTLQEAQKFVRQFVTGKYTPEELTAFQRWLGAATVEELTVITEMHESMHDGWVLSEGPSAEWVMQLERKLDVKKEVREEETVMDDREFGMNDRRAAKIRPAKIVEMRPGRRRRNIWIAAAAVVILLLTSTYIYVSQLGARPGEMADRTKLLSMSFVNPRGGAQKALVLEDGSKVWLSAGSELKYPPHFNGSERLVELSGEAFFDVAGNPASPFRVLIKDAEVEVLGTFFTVMAYDDEPASRTTLVEGSVKISSGGMSKVLRPGEQAEVPYASPGVTQINVNGGFDARLVRGWKNGIYHFKNTELAEIMREVARAYNVTVQYQSNVGNQRIDGYLDLNKSLDVNLELLEGSLLNKIHFNHNGKIVIASPT
ncbi:MAG TPA: FecR domain-containing protein [Puia sp.]|jgi:ferric-dicitrate binding protein FerR (iron transport regulator)|nr:FecR domain-containing protein [Puia sp.]